MAHLLKPGGIYYLSTPIGDECVEFNANWVFNPNKIIHCAEVANMMLQKLIIITPMDGPQELPIDAAALSNVALKPYQLGLFIFVKLK